MGSLPARLDANAKASATTTTSLLAVGQSQKKVRESALRTQTVRNLGYGSQGRRAIGSNQLSPYLGDENRRRPVQIRVGSMN